MNYIKLRLLRMVRNIKPLDQKTIRQLAAGEVVERPASVVKELIDNSIDASATKIQIYVENGGLDLIRVVDNGTGIPREDLELCVQKHATSKISSPEDLYKINTLGFRGEALYAIASVSRLRIRSKHGDSPGAELECLSPGNTRIRTVGMPQGTQVEVRNLFYNVPARLKFIGGPTSEASRITSTVKQYALGHPNIAFELQIDGKKQLETFGKGNILDCIGSVFGLQIRDHMIPVAYEEDEIEIKGYVSLPSINRSNRSDIHVFVNGRPVSAKQLMFAIQESYSSLLMVGRFPIVIINLLIPPEFVDVNVHPTKAEVRFADDRRVASVVGRTIRTALQEAFSSRDAELPQDDQSQGKLRPLAFSFNSASISEKHAWHATTSTQTHQHIESTSTEATSSLEEERTLPKLPPLRVLGQIALTYIIAEGPNGMYLIDQHAAHERILLERIQKELETDKVASQMLLDPLIITLGDHQATFMKNLVDELNRLGFEAESFGVKEIIVRSIPAILPKEEVMAFIEDLCQDINNFSNVELRRNAVAVSLACRSAIKAGQQLSMQEMRSLIEQLEQTNFPTACAHGRPTILELTKSQLEREFGRKG